MCSCPFIPTESLISTKLGNNGFITVFYMAKASAMSNAPSKHIMFIFKASDIIQDSKDTSQRFFSGTQHKQFLRQWKDRKFLPTLTIRTE